MDQWNKGGLSREEFLRMRESAIRQLRELAQKQQAERGAKTAPQQIGYARAARPGGERRERS